MVGERGGDVEERGGYTLGCPCVAGTSREV